MNFVRNFTALRKQKGLSQEQMAEKCGVSRSAIAKWETGATTPNIYIIGEIAKIFNVTVDELLYGKVDNSVDNTIEEFYSRIDKKMEEILVAVKNKDNNADLYESYCKKEIMLEETDVEFSDAEFGNICFGLGTQAIKKLDYEEAIYYLERALIFGVSDAASVLMYVHQENMKLYAADDLEYYLYFLDLVKKMQQYGRIIETEIKNGNII